MYNYLSNQENKEVIELSNEEKKKDIETTVDLIKDLDRQSLLLIQAGAQILKARNDMEEVQTLKIPGRR